MTIAEARAQAEALGFECRYDAEQNLLLAEITDEAGNRASAGIVAATDSQLLGALLYEGWWTNELRTKRRELEAKTSMEEDA